MIIDEAQIEIRNLRLRTYIGFNPEEIEKKQDVVINIDLRYRAADACHSDNEEEALDYKVITKAVIRLVEEGRFRLLEKLTSDVLHLVMSYPRVSATQVSIEKPHALRFSDSVAVTLRASRGEESK